MRLARTLQFAACVFTVACAQPDSTAPEEAGIATIEIAFSRSNVDLAVLDTVTVSATVRDQTGRVVSDAVVAWSLEGAVGAMPGVGTIESTGPRSARLRMELGTGVLIASSGSVSARMNINATRRRWRGFIWSEQSGFTEIPAPTGYELMPLSLNDQGEVAGTMYDRFTGIPYAFVWSATKGVTKISAAGFEGRSIGTAIDNHGRVTGSRGSAGYPLRFFIWSPGYGFVEQEYPVTPAVAALLSYSSHGVSLSGNWIAGNARFAAFRFNDDTVEMLRGNGVYEQTEAVAINAKGEVVGYVGVDELEPVMTRVSAVIWNTEGHAVEIQPGCAWVCQISVGDINDASQVAGSIRNSAFRWAATTGMETLTTPDQSRGRAINRSGDVLVVRGLAETFTRASVWTSTGKLVDIVPPPEVIDVFAMDINSERVVTGYYR